MISEEIVALLDKAVTARQVLFEPEHRNALRLFNGFIEGEPGLVADLYGSTLVFFNHAHDPANGVEIIKTAAAFLQGRLPWIKAGIVKSRNSPSQTERQGRILFGAEIDRKVREDRVWYALDLCMNQDTSLYLDTRGLRRWAIQNLAGKTVLNTFAYTGALGTAAMAGGAQRVVQTDIDRQFLNLAKSSYSLNGFPINKADFLTGDFWQVVGRLKRSGQRFDCVMIDPPFFSTTNGGKLDLNTDSARLINKVRPLIKDGGRLVSVNNAVYVSGVDYMQTLESLCADGYLRILELIPVPQDFTGYPETQVGRPITDPNPFNHSTKIAVLEVKRN